MAQIALPAMRRMALMTGGTVLLAIRTGWQALSSKRVDGLHAIEIDWRKGDTAPVNEESITSGFHCIQCETISCDLPIALTNGL